MIEPFVKSARHASVEELWIAVKQSQIESLSPYIGEYPSVRFVPVEPHAEMPLSLWRFHLYISWSYFAAAEDDWILTSDLRDTVFQSDPFATRFKQTLSPVNLFEEDRRMTIATCPYNTNWIRNCWGTVGVAEIGKNSIICSANTMGRPAALRDFWNGVLKTAMAVQSPSCFSSGIDQGILNYYYYHDGGNVSNTHVWRRGLGPVNTVGYIESNNLPVNSDGLVVNDDGILSPVVHQYDRFPVLIKRYHSSVWHSVPTHPQCGKVCELAQWQQQNFVFANDPASVAWLFETVVELLGGCDGQIFIDVGANTGSDPGMLGYEIPRACGQRNYTAFLFEPNPLVLKHLKEATRDIEQLIVVGKGVSSSDGAKLPFFGSASDERAQIATLSRILSTTPFGYVVQNNFTTVETITLDSALSSTSDAQRIALLKVDVEGHEYEVFLGAARLFATHRLPLIVYECHGAFNEEEWPYPANTNFFSSLGYDNWIVQGSGMMYRVDFPYFSSQMWTHRSARETNCVAIARDWQLYAALVEKSTTHTANEILVQQLAQGADVVQKCNCFGA